MHIGPSRCPLYLVAPALLSCAGFDPSLLEQAGGGGLPPSPNGPVSDPTEDAATCFPQVEYCNGRDDDCDDAVDEDAESTCRFGNAVGACASDGRCVIAECMTGFLDCNRVVNDGCEARDDGEPCAPTGGVTSPDPDDPGPAMPDASPPPDAGMPDACTPATETCDDADNDCDTKIDEGMNCAQIECVAGTPSYRGQGCDECVCMSCTTQLMNCQHHTDANWAQLCRDLVECYVVEGRAGNCGTNNDCYMSGNGPCAAEINLAAGGSSGTDTSQVAAGCATGSPPASACAGATQYRDNCTRTTCMSACAQ